MMPSTAGEKKNDGVVFSINSCPKESVFRIPFWIFKWLCVGRVN